MPSTCLLGLPNKKSASLSGSSPEVSRQRPVMPTQVLSQVEEPRDHQLRPYQRSGGNSRTSCVSQEFVSNL